LSATYEEPGENALATQANPFGSKAPVAPNAATDVAMQRALAEVQGAMIIAQRFPRDERVAFDRVINAFQRPSLAEHALYAYARGGTEITGPSIRAAEAIAQAWGNIEHGIVELEQRAGESTVLAFAWDLQTNTRSGVTFQVKHERHTRSGVTRLTDPRDIYETVANQGARRLRARILAIIPADVVDAAVQETEKTLRAKVDITPERIASLVEKFAAFSVPKEAIEKRIQRRMDTVTPSQVLSLAKIYNSLKDGMSAPADWFDLAPPAPATGTTTARVSDKLAQTLGEDAAAVPAAKPPPKPAKGKRGANAAAPEGLPLVGEPIVQKSRCDACGATKGEAHAAGCPVDEIDE
jgi:hypothetical protein